MRTKTFNSIQKRQIRVLYYATLVLFLPLFAGIFFLFTKDSQKDSMEGYKVEEVIPKDISLSSVNTTAHSAFVMNLNTGNVLYEKNSNKLLPLASLTKLVTAKVAYDNLSVDKLTIEKSEDFPEYGDSRLQNGEYWNSSDLITYTLLTSSNDGAHSLLKNSTNTTFSFTQKMNSFVATIGLSQTEFKNETGLDNDATGVPNTKGTAQEFAKLLSYLTKNDLALFEKTKHSHIFLNTPDGVQDTVNTNSEVNNIVGILMSKTGYTDLAGGNLAIVTDMGLNEPTAFVVLKSSRESRFDDILKLQENYFEQLRQGMK
jgi:D-alanyl-D-alanine carboxypeptidase